MAVTFSVALRVQRQQYGRQDAQKSVLLQRRPLRVRGGLGDAFQALGKEVAKQAKLTFQPQTNGAKIAGRAPGQNVFSEITQERKFLDSEVNGRFDVASFSAQLEEMAEQRRKVGIRCCALSPFFLAPSCATDTAATLALFVIRSMNVPLRAQRGNLLTVPPQQHLRSCVRSLKRTTVWRFHSLTLVGSHRSTLAIPLV